MGLYVQVLHGDIHVYLQDVSDIKEILRGLRHKHVLVHLYFLVHYLWVLLSG